MTRSLTRYALALPIITTPLVLAGSPPTALVREGDDLGVDGVVTGIDGPAVNHVGGWSFRIDSGGLDRFFGAPSGGAGTVQRSQMQIDMLDQTSFESFSGLADDGTIAYSASCEDLDSGTTGLDSLWFGDTLILIEEDPIPGMPGMFWSFGSRPGVGSSIPTGVAGLTDTPGGPSLNRALVQGLDATIILMGGDQPANLPAPLITGSGVDFDYRFSKSGTGYVTAVTIDTTSATDGSIVRDDEGLLIDGALVQEGSPLPMAAGGLPGENWDNFDFFGITDSGTYMFTGDSDGDVATDEFILIDDQIVLREGATVDGQVLNGSIESGYLNENGDYAVVWDVGDPSVEALVVNGALILKEGDPIDLDGDGALDPTTAIDAFTGISALALSDRDRGVVRAYCTADVDTGGPDLVEVALCVTVPVASTCQCDFNGNGQVDVDDLLVVLANWGGPGGDCTGDGNTDVSDLLAVLAEWGLC